MKKLLYILSIGLFACTVRAQTNVQTINYSYDANGRLTSAYYTRGSTNMAVLFTYDLNNNRNIRTDYGLTEANGDIDSDNLDDATELSYFGDLSEDGTGDPDADGLANSNEFDSAGNPLLEDTDNDGMGDKSEFIAGTALDDDTKYFHVADATPNSGMVRLTWDVKAGRTYQLQKSYDLKVSWSDVGSPFNVSVDDTHTEDQPSETNVSYRVAVSITTP